MGGAYGASRFDGEASPFGGAYTTPGWQRAQRNVARDGGRLKSAGPLIEGELVAREAAGEAGYSPGERVFHIKFGYGTITSLDGNKLTVDFEKAGRKRVLDSFVERH
jgi:DNA helicase-2/ATP-dependent DNA helicase PcrA